MTYIPAQLRERIRTLAKGRCEYCLRHEDYSERAHEVDHIRPEKHRGQTVAENLCLSCFDCNRFKGSNLCSIDPDTDELTSLFNPRTQQWAEIFRLEFGDMTIVPLTGVGRVTVLILELNTADRAAQRLALARVGVYPDPPEET